MDLVGGGYDLSIRIGDLPSSTLKRRKIRSVRHVLVASPQFLLQHGPVNLPQNLTAIPYIAMSAAFDTIVLTRSQCSETVRFETSQIQVQSILGAKSATLAGLGVGNLPYALVQSNLEAGELTHVLPDWELPALNVQAVWSANSHRRALASRFVDYIGGTSGNLKRKI